MAQSWEMGGLMTELPSATPAENKWKSGFIGGVTGALGATIVAFIFSSTALTFMGKFFGYQALPSAAIVFVDGGDCGPGWTKFDRAEGHFLVAAGTNTQHGKVFRPGEPNNGVIGIKLEERHLPEVKLSVPFTVIRWTLPGLGPNPLVGNIGDRTTGDTNANIRSAELSLGGRAEPIESLPPWIALTACRKSP